MGTVGYVRFLIQSGLTNRSSAAWVKAFLPMSDARAQVFALRSYEVEISPEEASLYRRRFFQTYPGLKRWHNDERRAWLHGGTETRTLTGRRRMDVERLTDRLNAPVQGTAADGLKLGLARLWERRDECPGATPVLVCHDEVVVECDTDKAEEAKEWLVGAMKDGMDAVVNVMEPHILIEVKTSVSKMWSD
jgi:DNA polymerase-1